MEILRTCLHEIGLSGLEGRWYKLWSCGCILINAYPYTDSIERRLYIGRAMGGCIEQRASSIIQTRQSHKILHMDTSASMCGRGQNSPGFSACWTTRTGPNHLNTLTQFRGILPSVSLSANQYSWKRDQRVMCQLQHEERYHHRDSARADGFEYSHGEVSQLRGHLLLVLWDCGFSS